MASIEAARRSGFLKASKVDRVIVDTTVVPKAIVHPTDTLLLEKGQRHLVKVAAVQGLSVNNTYNRIVAKLVTQIARYAHADQGERMRRSVRTLRARVGWVQREVARQLRGLPDQAQPKVSDLL